jgi:hypothetical protein
MVGWVIEVGGHFGAHVASVMGSRMLIPTSILKSNVNIDLITRPLLIHIQQAMISFAHSTSPMRLLLARPCEPRPYLEGACLSRSCLSRAAPMLAGLARSMLSGLLLASSLAHVSWQPYVFLPS